MTLVQFQVFLAVIEVGSFTKAAEKLNMTQSAVSQTIHALEEELGVTLLHRSRAGVSPTHIGERMQSHVREILYHTRCMTEEANASKGLESGTLRIASTPSISARFLPGVLGSFKKRFPQVHLVLFEGGNEEVEHWITNAVVDVGFMTLPGGDGMESIPLVYDNLTVFLPTDHRLSSQANVTLEDISSDPFIMPKVDADGFIPQLFRSHHLPVDVQFEVQDTATVLAMVQEGIGVTMLPNLAVPATLPKVHAATLVPRVARQVGIGVRSLAKVPPIVAEFLLHTRDYVRGCQDCDVIEPTATRLSTRTGTM